MFMRRLSGSILFFALTCMLCIQGLGLHLHIAEVATGQETELHQAHLNPSDLHSRGHDHGLSHGHEHDGEVDVDIAQLGSPVSAIKWLKAGFVPVYSSDTLVLEFVAERVTLVSLDTFAPKLQDSYSIGPPLRAPPVSA